jgi:hypothetical protein
MNQQQSKFKKAEKKKSKLRLGITGPSGSGKTYSALRLASGLSSKIAVIDTEKGSASLYADNFNFDVLELAPPYSPERYIEAMNDAVKEGYELIIMDSISHAWAGDGGLLNKKEQLDARGGNSFSNWAKMTPIQERFVASLVNCPAHLIVTMRSKQEYILEQNEKGKQAPKKVGLAPIQREGFEYELTTVFDVGMAHTCETSKDRTNLFVDKIFQITEETGQILKDWLELGKIELIEEPKQVETVAVQEIKEIKNHAPANPPASMGQFKQIKDLYSMIGLNREDLSLIIKDLFKIEELKLMTFKQAEIVIKMLSESTSESQFKELVSGLKD